jgi:hypothetical protein
MTPRGCYPLTRADLDPTRRYAKIGATYPTERSKLEHGGMDEAVELGAFDQRVDRGGAATATASMAMRFSIRSFLSSRPRSGRRRPRPGG